jgi:hypothetical protein
MSFKQKDLHWRIDLFDTQLQRINRGVLLPSIGTAELYDFQFIYLLNHEWFVMDRDSKPQMLLLLEKNGTLKQQVENENYSLALMGEEFLVLRNKAGLHFYKLSQKP